MPEVPRRGWTRWLDGTATLAGAIVLAAITLVSWVYLLHTRPMADDYSVAVQGAELGPAGYANLVYATKPGRWTGHALLALVLARVDLASAYPWLLGSIALARPTAPPATR